MTHPHHLHARAALWSLRAARRQLHRRTEWTVSIDPTSAWRSPRYGTRTGSGGHSDPIGSALESAARDVDRYGTLAERTTATLTWLARKLDVAGPGDPLGPLLDAVPHLRPGTARELHRWVLEADHDVRKALGIDADRAPIVGAACPSCGTRLLEAQNSAPNPAHWTVVCTSGEVCSGDTCTCGMPVKAAGVMHIWRATSALAKRWLDTLAEGGRSAA